MSETAGPNQFGRVSEDGTVYVITSSGERRVGQVPDVDASAALEFFVRRFTALETEVDVLSKRIASGTVKPQEARRSISQLRRSIDQANAVGDLEGLERKLEELTPAVEHAQEEREAQRAEQAEASKAAKEEIVARAEKIAQGKDWRGGPNKFRELLEEWKQIPRVDRKTDDELWARFSAARTSYTKRRKHHMGEQKEQQAAARKIKEKIIERAEQIADSTDWGPTSAEFGSLMAEWRAAGGAGRGYDDTLWKQFRALQDQFFGARQAMFDAEEADYRANQEAKEKLLAEAEAEILPVSDAAAARSQFREFLAKYNEFGRVPRSSMRPLENRVRSLEQAVKEAEDTEWRRTDPETRQRAESTAGMFSAQIAKLERDRDKAREAGKEAKVRELEESIASYQSLLEQARKTLEDFAG